MSPRTDLSAVGGDTTPDGFTISILFMTWEIAQGRAEVRGYRGLRRIGRKPFAGASSIPKRPSRSGSGRAGSAAGNAVRRLGLDRFPDFRALVRGEIVDQDDVSFRERWSKHFFDISEETFAIDRAVEEGGGDAIMAKRGHESRRLRMPCGTLA
jgi:hypothetical protein